tara:strand:+ start:985 stop:1392 length:408 start_codon:yes stop_codon:yes gene_type:complete
MAPPRSIAATPQSPGVFSQDPVDRLSSELSGRDRFPEERLKEFRRLPDKELEEAIENTREVRALLERQMRRSTAVWRHLELALFSCDHDWRRIAGGLNRLARNVECGELIELALGRYVAYLRAREFALCALLECR